ncbi:Gfo/Idh/MocA family oxidoreductase [Sporolactobacillus shoreae]|uniref:Gfo/Idh/MocA family oxidoreductase n=1 Tax=Sporolactobacillus shoreae TaxID=1465501 RepID=A0A4Z0GKI2_9BACL|nr:Gfo/Idh/MocA family oxidoreductase [Sporolactobacillus shoreae]TGA96594.1 Gfo/Idh/MocA family oxidoreductase [Sporolactobacillus shoreae]
MKLATIGTSRITDSFLRSVKATGRMTYTTAYSRSEEKAKAFSRQHGGEFWFTSIEELAQSSEVDIVYVASPNGLHFTQVMTLLEGGKHVICEKPIFATLNEFDQAFSLAEKKHVFLFEAIRNIRTPVFQRLKEELPKAGKIRSAVLQLIQYSSRYDEFLKGNITNIFSPEFAGGALEDLGVYPLYVAVALFGAPDDAVYYPVKLSNGIDGSGTLVLRYDGFVCTILCSKIAHSDAPSEIHGEKGTFSMNNSSNIRRLEWTDAHTKEKRCVTENTSDNDKIYEIAHFADVIEHQDTEEYVRLKMLSREVLRVMEKSRKQNGILFPNDRA